MGVGVGGCPTEKWQGAGYFKGFVAVVKKTLMLSESESWLLNHSEGSMKLFSRCPSLRVNNLLL